MTVFLYIVLAMLLPNEAHQKKSKKKSDQKKKNK